MIFTLDADDLLKRTNVKRPEEFTELRKKLEEGRKQRLTASQVILGDELFENLKKD